MNDGRLSANSLDSIEEWARQGLTRRRSMAAMEHDFGPLRPAKFKIAAFVAEVYRQTMRCRIEHGCHIYPFEHSDIASVLAAAMDCKRILELGCGLGFATLWLAHGAKHAHIDAIDHDDLHVWLARENFAEFGIAERVTLHRGEFTEVLPTLAPGYDLALFDGWAPRPEHLAAFERLLRPGGMLISSNLMYAASQHPDADVTRAYSDGLFGAAWYSSIIGCTGNSALSVRMCDDG